MKQSIILNQSFVIELLAFLLFVATIFSCTKEAGSSGNVSVTVITEGERVSQATVTLHDGCDTAQLAVRVRKRIRANAEGIVYFEALPSGPYTISARGYSQKKKRYVQGKACVVVKDRQRQNTYELSVLTN